jgi:hypothetical protein
MSANMLVVSKICGEKIIKVLNPDTLHAIPPAELNAM